MLERFCCYCGFPCLLHIKYHSRLSSIKPTTAILLQRFRKNKL
ncbi:hypothetical protein MCHI_001786 [Candidatus Magnetoovum chiemensis]|nr:hypothetical protein MCHI_001784 [Candidatus Magnetoovum chiemensis]KJR42318.1 hypothetical protein MCHI_001786 [Candidatus Magnetoovum chiemensis]